MNLEEFKSPAKKLLMLVDQAQEYSVAGDYVKASEAYDQVRHLRSLFGDLKNLNFDELQYQENDPTANFRQSLQSDLAALNGKLESLNIWFRLIGQEIDVSAMLQDELGRKINLDLQMPEIWNWKTSAVIIRDDEKWLFYDELKARGQQNLVILGSDEAEPPEGELHIGTDDDVAEKISNWAISETKAIMYLHKEVREEVLETTELITQEIKQKFMNKVTIDKFAKRWGLQHVANLPSIARSHSLEDLGKVIKGQNVILVSPGPSLEKNIEYLQAAQQTHVIIAPVQSAQALALVGVKPDLFFVVDPEEYYQVLDGFPCEEVIGLVHMDAVHPNFLKKDFPRFFTYPNGVFPKITKEILRGHQVDTAGGSVSVVACSIACSLGAQSVALMGQDLSVGERNYFYRSGVDGVDGPDTLAVSRDEVPTKTLPGWSGGEVKTFDDYFIYHGQFKGIASGHGDTINLFNCTEGGAYIEGFKHIALLEYLELTKAENLRENLVPLLPVSTKELDRRLGLVKRYLFDERRLLSEVIKLTDKSLKMLDGFGPHERPNLEKLTSVEKKIGNRSAKAQWFNLIAHSSMGYANKVLEKCDNTADMIATSKTLHRSINASARDLNEAVLEATQQLQTECCQGQKRSKQMPVNSDESVSLA